MPRFCAQALSTVLIWSIIHHCDFIRRKVTQISNAYNPPNKKTAAGKLPAWLTARPIAHRGLHDMRVDAPENSLAAFSRALAQDMPIELDVRVSADGRAVVFHDDTLMRMAGVRGTIQNCLWQDIRNLRLCGTGEHIPSLEDVLSLVDGRTPLLIELKNDGRAGQLERAVAQSLENYGGTVAVQSFNPLSLKWFRKNTPHLIRGQLAGIGVKTLKERAQAFMFNHLLLNFLSRPHFIAYNIRLLPRKSVSRLRSAGVPVIGWTADDPDLLVRQRPYVDNFIFEGACTDIICREMPKEDTP